MALGFAHAARKRCACLAGFRVDSHTIKHSQSTN
jgi:hypothetical protein